MEKPEPNIILDLPHEKYKDSYIKAVIENRNNPVRNESDIHYDNVDLEKARTDFHKEVVQPRLDKMDKSMISADRTPSTEYWIIDKDGYAGRIRVAHYLNNFLESGNGHIGYDVIPSKRGRGYVKKALILALEEAKKMGIDEAILSCYTDYAPSRKAIENAMRMMGGRIIKHYEEDGKDNIQFAIKTSKKISPMQRDKDR